jgi:hypothetical protein
MNWMGFSVRAFMAALVGCALGFVLFGFCYTRGYEAEWVVGVIAGGFVGALSTDKSIMRGLIVGTMAVWTAALAQVVYVDRRSPMEGLVRFHETLTPWRFVLHLLCAGVAIALAATSFQRGARRRILGA